MIPEVPIREFQNASKKFCSPGNLRFQNRICCLIIFSDNLLTSCFQTDELVISHMATGEAARTDGKIKNETDLPTQNLSFPKCLMKNFAIDCTGLAQVSVAPKLYCVKYWHDRHWSLWKKLTNLGPVREKPCVLQSILARVLVPLFWHRSTLFFPSFPLSTSHFLLWARLCNSVDRRGRFSFYPQIFANLPVGGAHFLSHGWEPRACFGGWDVMKTVAPFPSDSFTRDHVLPLSLLCPRHKHSRVPRGSALWPERTLERRSSQLDHQYHEWGAKLAGPKPLKLGSY